MPPRTDASALKQLHSASRDLAFRLTDVASPSRVESAEARRSIYEALDADGPWGRAMRRAKLELLEAADAQNN